MLDELALSQTHRELLERATAAYQQNVWEAADYLDSRGISEQIALDYRLGVVADPVPGHERFVGMLCLPYLSRAGVLAVKFRQLDPTRKPKYDQPSQHVRMYNVNALQSTGDVVAVCEGEIDAIVMTELVGVPAVGIPGATQWAPHWGRCFADYQEVLVIADNDVREDGTNPGMSAAEKTVKKVPGGRIIRPPAGEDLNSWVIRSGVEAVRDACGL